jgi:hypothetical protein
VQIIRSALFVSCLTICKKNVVTKTNHCIRVRKFRYLNFKLVMTIYRAHSSQTGLNQADHTALYHTATLRSLLDDFSFEFVEGTVPQLEGSWSRHYQSSPRGESTSLYAYCKMLDLGSLFEAGSNLLDLLQEEDPPFEGVLAYSSGAALAAQVFLQHESHRRSQPQQTNSSPLFKFAVFCNAVTPGRLFKLEDQGVRAEPSNITTFKEEVIQILGIVSGFRMKAAPQMAPQIAKRRIMDEEVVAKSFKAMMLSDGTPFLTDGTYCVAPFDLRHGPQLSIPTLHIRDLEEPRQLGLEMLEICDARLAREYHHSHGHEFPRGYSEMKEIARLIRDVADAAS